METVVAIDGTACKEETKNNKTYYRVKTALTVGNSTTGSAHQLSDTYLDSSDSKVKKISQYDLAALGYQIVDEPNTSTNGYVKPDQVVTGFFKKLLEKVDTDYSKELDANEIKAAQSNPELQPILGKIIGGHPSEWHSSTQQNIKTLFETKKATCTDTAHKNLLDFEKLRLQACEFMSQIPLAQKVWHLHPIKFLSSVKSQGKITVELLENISGNNIWFRGRGGSASYKDTYKNTSVYAFDKEAFVILLNEVVDRYEINKSEYHLAHFISQITLESAGFDTTLEYASGNGYNPGQHAHAIENGNELQGDGPKHKGRGLLQLTWKNNYKKYSAYKYENEDFLVTNYELVSNDMNIAIDSAGWFWRNNGGVKKKYKANGDINILIDNEKNNCDLVSLAVNGGANGLAERRVYFSKIKEIWGLE